MASRVLLGHEIWEICLEHILVHFPYGGHINVYTQQ